MLYYLFAVLAFASFARCDDGSDKDNDWKKPPARALDVQNTNHGFDLKLDQKGINVTSRLEFEFETHGFPRYRARYFTKKDRKNGGNSVTGTSDTTVEAAGFEFRVGLWRVVEFVDVGGDGLNSEPAVRTLNFIGNDGKGKFSPVISSTFTVTDAVTNATANGLKWTCFSPPTATGATDEKLQIVITITDAMVNDALQNRSHAPNNLKFDLNLLNFNYSRNDTTVAFVFAIDSTAVVKHIETTTTPTNLNDTEGAVDVGDGQGRMTYVKTVDVRRRNTTATLAEDLARGNADLLVGSVLAADDHSGDAAGSDDDDKRSSEVRRMITFAVNGKASLASINTSQPSSIFWDPSVGVNDVLLDAGSSAGFGLSFSPLLLIVSMFVAFFA